MSKGVKHYSRDYMEACSFCTSFLQTVSVADITELVIDLLSIPGVINLKFIGTVLPQISF